MRSFSLLLLVIFSGVISGEDLFGMRLTTESLQKKENNQYRFHYFVKDDTTGDYKVQEETKHGDLVHGSYTLAEPNGDLRTVTYKAGPGKGFEAKVDVHPSGSPMKHTIKEAPVLEPATAAENMGKTEKPMKVESVVKNFPGGFQMDVLRKQPSDMKTEMGIKFSLKPHFVTAPAVISNKTESEETDKPESTSEVPIATISLEPPSINVESSAVKNSTLSKEDTEISEDLIKKEIDEAINFMPKLPELVLSDNKTRFKFHKDPEEALLDERITQIARQLAETSLRREYEERKLGHFIPISVSSVEPSSTSSYLSKSFKHAKNNLSNFRPLEPSTYHVLTQLKIIPQYIYKQTLIPRLFPVNHRLPVVNKVAQITEPWELQTQEKVTNPPDLLKINAFEKKLKQQNKISEKKAINAQSVSIMPFHVPTTIQFFTPYVMHNTGSNISQGKPDVYGYTSTVIKNLTTEELPVSEDTLFASVKMVNNNSTEKP